MFPEKGNALPEQQSDRAINWSDTTKGSNIPAPIVSQAQEQCQDIFRVDLNIDSIPYRTKAEAKAEYGIIRNRMQLVTGFPLPELPTAVIQGYTFTPAAMTGTGGDSWQSQQLFCVDIDNESDTILTPESAIDILHTAGIQPLFLYYSFSSTQERPRFRIVIATTVPVTDATRAERIRKGLISLFPSADQSAADPARMFLGTNKGLALPYTGATVSPAILEQLYSEPEPKQTVISSPSAATTPYVGNDLADAIEQFNLAGYIEQDTGTQGKQKGNRIFFNPCPICGHRDDFDVNGAVFICRSASGLNGGGGNIINYLEHRNGWSRIQAREYFMYNILGWEQKAPSTHQKSPFALSTNESVKPADFTDVGNMRVFVRKYKDRLCYTKGLGWLFWNGIYWESGDEHALQLATELSEQMLAEAIKLNRDARHNLTELQISNLIEDDNFNKSAQKKAHKAVVEADEYIKHAKYTRRSARLKAILELSIPYLIFPDNKIDSDPLNLNTPKGIVNLINGVIRPNMPEDYCTKVTAVAPDTKGADLWENFIDTITCGDVDLAEFLQQIAGMSLIGSVYQEGAIFATGNGRNGKSTFFNALRSVLADYAGTINIDVLMISKYPDKAAMTSLRGKRLIVAGELEEGKWLSAAMLKRLCSTDDIAIEPKYREAFSISPSHTLCLFTNHLPKVFSRDEATWRRIIIVPFNAQIDQNTAIQNYAAYLVKHAGGAILTWAIEGAKIFCENHFKLKIPECVKQASETYRNSEDWLKAFVNNCCEVNPDEQVKASDLYDRYRIYAETQGISAYDKNRFAYEIGNMCFSKKHTNQGWIYLGLKLL